MKDEGIDEKIKRQFGELHDRAVNGDLEDWKSDPNACLASVIVLDQFSRNMFRGDAKTFAYDPLALEIAREAIDRGHDVSCDQELYSFFYMPLMHSESLRDQEDCVILMHRMGQPGSLSAAVEHRDIIRRFGRFPHRNPVLGRHTTPAEKVFLEEGGFKG